jgi:hypothetical protein
MRRRSPAGELSSQVYVLDAVLCVYMLGDPVKPEFRDQRERWTVAWRNRSHKAPDVMGVSSPTHGAGQRFQGIAASSMGGIDDVAEFNRVAHVRVQVFRIRPTMEPNVADHLHGTPQDDGSRRPREIIGILCQSGGRVLQNRGLPQHVDGDACSQPGRDGFEIAREAGTNRLRQETAQQQPWRLDVREKLSGIGAGGVMWKLHERHDAIEQRHSQLLRYGSKCEGALPRGTVWSGPRIGRAVDAK